MISFLGQNVSGNDFPPAPRKLEKGFLARADQKRGPCFLNASNVVKHLTVIYGEDAERKRMRSSGAISFGRVALKPPLTWPSEVFGGFKRLGGSYVGLPTMDLFQTDEAIVFLDKGRFNRAVHSKAEIKHLFSHGCAP